MTSIRIRRHAVTVLPESARVIIRPFIPPGGTQVHNILQRALDLTEEQVSAELSFVCHEFEGRHFDIKSVLQTHFGKVSNRIDDAETLSQDRQLLIGALFSGEYALESAAIFNPSIVLHPDQSDAPLGGVRFIMSLRATGEGHISSIEFRAGSIDSDGNITLDPVSRFVTEPKIVPNPKYHKERFLIKLNEMGVEKEDTQRLLAPLGARFTRGELETCVGRVREENPTLTHGLEHTLDCIQWLADSNYQVRFGAHLAVSERIIFPVSPNETNGIEDARFVRFLEDDGTVTYYATYTAYNGHDILPQLIKTDDFLDFNVLTLNGDAVRNKGMALFPRRVNGRYAMLSRQDDENLFIMYSDSPYHWTRPEIIMRPSAVWEAVKIGNCGSPLETEAGWLVITHGVGPMRKYCIGAILLDLHDPGKVIGRLREPLLYPEGNEREGYVPNVVYSCGSMINGPSLILPFAMSDQISAIATVSLEDLLRTLTSSGC